MTTPAPLPTSPDKDAATITVRSPYDGRELASVPRQTEADIDAAVTHARQTMRTGSLPRHERARILDDAARLLADRREQFARLISDEAAKPIRTARTEAARAVDTFRFAAAAARTVDSAVVPLDASSVGEGKVGFIRRVPIGVIGAISPFNFPLNLVAHKIAPAIAAGCAVVLKPASATPMSALALAALLHDDCGLPPGWLTVVTCPGSVANHLVEHPDVAMITFTGSPSVGWDIRARAPKKKVSLELGNNAPVIVEADADWEKAIDKIRVAGFSHAGQSCISTQRIFVARPIADAFVARLVNAVGTLVVGDPADEATDVSSLIDEGETDRVHTWIDDAVAAGARVACGGVVRDGLLEPTVLTDVRPEMDVCAREVFGPVVAVQVYDDLDEALRLANDSNYGLQAAIFTRDLSAAFAAADTLDYGAVLVNEVPTWRLRQARDDRGAPRHHPAHGMNPGPARRSALASELLTTT
jgi:acyl-CoA reductase-like NAD-dependent aldehyde dehydrogenase